MSDAKESTPEVAPPSPDALLLALDLMGRNLAADHKLTGSLMENLQCENKRLRCSLAQATHDADDVSRVAMLLTNPDFCRALLRAVWKDSEK